MNLNEEKLQAVIVKFLRFESNTSLFDDIGFYGGGSLNFVKSDELQAIIREMEEIVGSNVCSSSSDGKHRFFKCQVPAGDSCVAIYHEVCRLCRWDNKKGIFMPSKIWNGWAVPQLRKLDEAGTGGEKEGEDADTD